MAENRLGALDTLRGVAVAGMILVDSPGSWSDIYPQLKHAGWHGWTLADMVFPGFLVAMGMAAMLSLETRLASGRPRRAIFGQVLVRAAVLTAIGLVLNGFPDFDLAHLRIPGILQRIALCYVAASAIVLVTSGKGRAIAVTAAALLVAYWALLAFVPVPGFGAGRFDSLGSWPAFVDRHVFTVAHLWVWGTTDPYGVTYDPEGLLSTVPAVATTLIGVLCAQWIGRAELRSRWFAAIALAGIALLAAGLALDPLVPIVKKIWTPSFALLSGGFVLLVFAGVGLAEDVLGARRWTAPFRVLGANAILAFALCQLADVACDRPLLAAGPLRNLGFGAIQRVVPDAKAASLVFALATLAAFVLLLLPLYRRRIFLRV